MEKCSPVEMRKNLEAVQAFQEAGIDFIPIPVTSDENKEYLLELLSQQLIKLEQEGE